MLVNVECEFEELVVAIEEVRIYFKGTNVSELIGLAIVFVVVEFAMHIELDSREELELYEFMFKHSLVNDLVVNVGSKEAVDEHEFEVICVEAI